MKNIRSLITALAAGARNRLRAAWQHVRPSTQDWARAGTGALLAALVVLAIGVAMGPSAPAWVWAASLLFTLVLTFALPVLGGHLAAWLVDLFHRLPYAFRWRAAAAILILLSLTGPLSTRGKVLFITLVIITGALIVTGAAALARGGLSRPRRWMALVSTAAGVVALALSLVWYAWPGTPEPEMVNAARLSGRPAAMVTLPNPDQSGPYTVRTLTYGSSTDRFRPEFGAKVDWVSEPVDGSRLLNGSLSNLSQQLRRWLWGFGFDRLPVNGRVWMPDGAEGPFPLVLIVHGNHASTEFSDPGYAYLGELLASRGMIFVSVDQNFLNGSFTDLFEGMKNENDARGWLLLEHIRQLTRWNEDSKSPFFGKVDLGRIAVGGHSRGGEAAAVAAAFNRLPFYPENGELAFSYNFKIRGVFAIAPIDGQYQPGDRGTALKDVDYLVLHGSHDADVRSFDGLNQFQRVRFEAENGFKAAVWVYRANHGQFNAGWGDSDMRGFARGLLSRGALLSAADQQQITRVFISAFLEAALLDRDGYRPLFQDPRSAGEGWLPNTVYITRYETSQDRLLATFEEDIDFQTLSSGSRGISGKNLDRWVEQRIPTRWGPGESGVVSLGWNEDQPAEYAIQIRRLERDLTGRDQLVFAIGDANRDPQPAGQQNGKGSSSRPAADLTLVLEDSLGREARVALSNRMPVQPEITTQLWKTNLLFDPTGSEPILQSYAFPLSDFTAANPALNLSALRVARFVFDRTARGSVILDTIGFRLNGSP